MPKQKYYWSKIQKWSGTDKNLRAPKSSTCGTAKSSSYTLATCLLADPQYNSFSLPNLRSCNSVVVDFKIWPQFFSTLICTCLCIETLLLLYHRWNLFPLLRAGVVTSNRMWHRWYHATLLLIYGIYRNMTRRMFTKC